MNTGQIISGIGHLGLIAWAVLGGAFQSEPLPFEVTEVTAISAEEYAALFPAERAPEAVANIDTPEPPEAGEAPGMASEADAAPEMAVPDSAGTPPPDDLPEVVEPAPPAEAEVSDAPPQMQPPQEDMAALVPEVSPRPQPRPAPRIAPEPVAPPEPDVEIDDVDRQEAAPEETAEPVEEEQQRETAREEAATEIVTEAEEEPAAAPDRSLRPRARPAARPAEAETETAAAQEAPAAEAPATEAPATETPATETPAEAPEVDNSSVEDAIAAALGGSETQADSTPSGPPLTAGEKDALRVAVQQCWNVGSLSTEALNTTVVVGVEMAEDGRPVSGSIRMIDATGGSDAAARQAFEAARRAIIRCGANGFDLPVEKYDHWRDIEMTFNPEKMRIK